MRVLIESTEPAAGLLAALLAGEGHDVTLEDPRDLDGRVPGADAAYLDVWTPEMAPRVALLRRQGTRLTCLGDLLLERWDGPTIGITGTAGKTSTTTLVASILRGAGVAPAVSAGARAGNLWPTGDLLERVAAGSTDATLLLELTSSHLAFMCHSPTVAAVTSFWPDHLELHGSLDRYRAAKAVIVRHQRPGDVAVLDAGSAAWLAADAPAAAHEISTAGRVARGAWLSEAGVVLEPSGIVLGHVEEGVPHPANAVAAAAVAVAAGVDPDAIAAGIRAAPETPWRAQTAGWLGGARVVDDGMAATPAKAAAMLRGFPERGVVLLAGGIDDGGAGPVHASVEEQRLLEEALDEVARAARLVVLFGDAGRRLVDGLTARGVPHELVADLAAAVATAAPHAAGADALVLAPLFPLPLEDRAAFAGLVRAAGGTA